MSFSALSIAGPWGGCSLKDPYPSTDPGLAVVETQFCLGDACVMKKSAVLITAGAGPPHELTVMVPIIQENKPRVESVFGEQRNF